MTSCIVSVNNSKLEALTHYLAKYYNLTVDGICVHDGNQPKDRNGYRANDLEHNNHWYKTEQMTTLLVDSVFTKICQGMLSHVKPAIEKKSRENSCPKKIVIAKQYSIFRCFTELVWRQVYTIVSSVHQVKSCVDTESLSLKIIDGEVSAVNFNLLSEQNFEESGAVSGAAYRNNNMSLEALIEHSAYSIKQWSVSIAELVHQVFNVKYQLLIMSLQDIVLSALASQAKLEYEDLRQYALLWLKPWQSRKNIAFITDERQSAKLLPIRRSCCFYFQVDSQGMCTNCPKLSRAKKYKNLIKIEPEIEPEVRN
ncbi:(2Fe-2S)-binding protein [Pleionea mediterranea]|uniref:FhuF-like iron-sulfur protein n=1 Tax=Pleionea mediterranea TaxID=523701 RepID=A0A316FSV4_9GAMM|nr:(2Fe-2S)-binding protein [Pleionea mediterranea]PWK51841.1 FhuF-like iron-sulfur protein [Pleionea mediterranea]